MPSFAKDLCGLNSNQTLPGVSANVGRGISGCIAADHADLFSDEGRRCTVYQMNCTKPCCLSGDKNNGESLNYLAYG